ncbi:MAG: F0F1 ATP synthase subunit gamma [Hyphomicrobiales bacterium]|nr:F0F1 ATP synthase subunit gamma [Hyphomicrobiales bacterium]
MPYLGMGAEAVFGGTTLHVVGHSEIPLLLNPFVADALDELSRSEHALRQEPITSELLDVVTGSAAILAKIDR